MSTNFPADVNSNLLAHSKHYQVGRVLKRLVETGDQIQAPQLNINPFSASQTPELSIEWYYVLLGMNVGLQEEQSIVILILIERLCNYAYLNKQPLVFNSLSAHR